ncbi:MAG: dephospho-CoA kinase [Polaribacter sp.]
MIVGLTGGIGSGKTTVINLFKNYKNVGIYITDIEAKKLMNTSDKIQTKIQKEFGVEAYKNGVLNRKFLSNLVFKNTQKLEVLNSIVHPEVKKHFQNFIQKNKDKAYIVYESAILFENNSESTCDFVISVFVELSERINRLLQREITTEEAIMRKINSQWKEEKKLLQSNYVIHNMLLSKTQEQVKEIHNILTEKSLLIS